MQIIWVDGNDDDGRHSLFATNASALDKIEDDMRHKTMRVCTFGKVYNYYPSSAPEIFDEKQLVDELKKVYMWCTYQDRHNIHEFALFASQEDLENFCDAQDKELLDNVKTELQELWRTMKQLNKIQDGPKANTARVKQLQKIKWIIDEIHVETFEKPYKCYEIQTNSVNWSGDSILPDEIYGCKELFI